MKMSHSCLPLVVSEIKHFYHIGGKLYGEELCREQVLKCAQEPKPGNSAVFCKNRKQFFVTSMQQIFIRP